MSGINIWFDEPPSLRLPVASGCKFTLTLMDTLSSMSLIGPLIMQEYFTQFLSIQLRKSGREAFPSSHSR